MRQDDRMREGDGEDMTFTVGSAWRVSMALLDY